MTGTRYRWLPALLLAGLAWLPACSGSGSSGSGSSASSSRSGGDTHIDLVAYSTPERAYAKLIAAFRRTPAGRHVIVSESFGPSGSQARAVVAGQPADVVNFSTESDMATLVKAKLVAPTWQSEPYGGMVTDSVVVFVVRKGNPKHIHTWADLVKPGVQVLTPNPFSSGSARWNIMAAYGAELKQGASPAGARHYLQELLSHVAVQDSSASSALTTFLTGKGDVLLDYEDAAIAAERAGEPVQYVVPKQTILIQNPIAVVEGSKHQAAARAFLHYLQSAAGQRLWGELGYRPVDPSVAATFHFPQPPDLFTISSFGGWSAVKARFFDPSSGIVTKIEQHLGVSTASG